MKYSYDGEKRFKSGGNGLCKRFFVWVVEDFSEWIYVVMFRLVEQYIVCFTSQQLSTSDKMQFLGLHIADRLPQKKGEKTC